MTGPENRQPPIEYHNTPATLSGLNAMPGNSNLVIDAIGIATDQEFFADSVTIVVGNSRGRDSATGMSYPYRYDAGTEVTRIVDLHGAPLFATDNPNADRARYVAIGWADSAESGERTRTAAPLMPGMRHAITSWGSREVLGWYEVTESGALHIERTNKQSSWTDVRAVGVHASEDAYASKSPLVPPAFIQRQMLELVEVATAQEAFNYDSLVLRPGLQTTALDSTTGQMVTYALERHLTVPNGQPGRFEAQMARTLQSRQEFFGGIQIRPAAPDGQK